MTYKELLASSAVKVHNCACMGLDPQWDVLPYRSGHIADDLQRFFQQLFETMVKYNLSPAAFKPNIGYYAALDDPRKGSFEGSLALASILSMLESLFPGIPVILDSKRGDIARSSANYAQEAFEVWRCDAVTVSPYMGTDSITPFDEDASGKKGIYVLNRTSNPGAKDLQALQVGNGDTREPLFMAVARQIDRWSERMGGIGAVVGATNLEELSLVATLHARHEVPLLIPGVGSQGASAKMTMHSLRDAGYPVSYARINSSSALTHPWKMAPAPSGWLDRCIANIDKLLEETAL